jgi:GNAT superfamily N-acetyltransferase
MSYSRRLPNGFEVVSTRSEFASALEELQNIVFPTLAPELRLQARHYLHHLSLFPQGQFSVLAGTRVVASTTSIRLPASRIVGQHRFTEILDDGWLNTHDPQGDCLYGIDMGVHPEFRGRGIARALYIARQQTVHSLGLRGQYTVGMPSGYGKLKDSLSAEEYYRKLQDGEISDPTVSAQQKIGFELRGLIPNYLDDPVCDGYGIALELPAHKAIADGPAFYR